MTIHLSPCQAAGSAPSRVAIAATPGLESAMRSSHEAA